MILLIDMGNTRVKVGYVNQDGVRLTKHSIAFTYAELDQLLPWLQQQGLHPQRALGVYVTAKKHVQYLEQLLQSIDCLISWQNGTTYCPLVENGYEQPERLGADRWLALIGILAQRLPLPTRPIVHASFGTATTIDTVIPTATSLPARFIGGLILPGPKMMYDSLALNTAQLGNGLGLIQDFPTNTRAAISSGVTAAQVGAVMQQWQLTWQHQQIAPLLICSGGGWSLVENEIKNAHTQLLHLLNVEMEPVYWQETPVLDGLAHISQYHL